ncbi:MAG: hypothetical protein EBV77_09375 [Gemmatimonadaceae bacterium]|uniref:hypothetical protein n=1 Tax=Gemmatimonas sp. TaxID=1962908 RepID=UPI001D8B3661|nr:hypothetical protein [Gemmatimonas sp.]NCW45655.1 hypothetical protein [Gemmatimonadaceae bacterium]
MGAQQYDPNKLGWGAALITCIFTAALGFGAYTIHNNTYRHPRDPMNQQVYYERDQAKHAAGGEHGAAAGEAGEHGAAEAAAPTGEKH